MMTRKIAAALAVSLLAGFAIAQEVKDPSGSLERRLERIEQAIDRLETKLSGRQGGGTTEGRREMMGGGGMMDGGMMGGGTMGRGMMDGGMMGGGTMGRGMMGGGMMGGGMRGSPNDQWRGAPAR